MENSADSPYKAKTYLKYDTRILLWDKFQGNEVSTFKEPFAYSCLPWSLLCNRTGCQPTGMKT